VVNPRAQGLCRYGRLGGRNDEVDNLESLLEIAGKFSIGALNDEAKVSLLEKFLLM